MNSTVYKQDKLYKTMTFNEFIKNQERIYDEFRSSNIEHNGIEPKVSNNRGGYIIALRHSKKITDLLGKLSRKASEIIPSITYDAQNIHTTISAYQVQEDFNPDSIILDKLSNTINESKPFASNIKIKYSEWLLNQDAVIAAGEPNESFYNLAKEIIAIAQQNGIELRLPWGAHITTNRFLESGSRENISNLLDLYNNSEPLGDSSPVSVDVGYFIINSHEFKLNVYKSFSLK